MNAREHCIKYLYKTAYSKLSKMAWLTSALRSNTIENCVGLRVRQGAPEILDGTAFVYAGYCLNRRSAFN